MLHPLLQEHLDRLEIQPNEPPAAGAWQRLLAQLSAAYAAADAQHQLLGTVFELLPDAVFVKDCAGRYLRVNPAHARRLGVSAADALGQTDDAFLAAVDASAGAELERQVLLSGEPLLDKLDTWSRPDGTFGWSLASRMPFRDASGLTQGVLGISRDLTEFMHVQDAWNEVEARFRSLVENIPGAVYRRRAPLGELEFASGTAATLLGYDPGTLPPLDALLHPADVAATVTAIRDALAQQQPYNVEYRARHADNRLRWVGDRGRGVFDADGELLWLDGVLFDITVHREAEAALIEAQAAAEAANQAKGQFLANMSHELRTPLNAILGYTELLTELTADSASPHLARDLQRIHAAGSHLLAVLNDILDLARIETGRTELHIDRFLVTDLLTAAVSATQARVEKNGNVLRLEYGAGLGVMQSDSARLRQMLVNLLDNAAKFTSEGSVALTATREQTPCGDYLRFVVADTGIGIAEEQLGQLFQPFVQADVSNTRAYGGTGLGLALSRRLCDLLGGTIRVSSQPGAGSHFTVVLPATCPAVACEL